MSSRIRSQPDFWSGALFIAVGGAFAAYAPQYGIGTATNMGPGYFPLVLGALLALIGVVVLAQSFSSARPRETVDRMYFKPMALVLVPMVIFGTILVPMGFVIASVMLIVLTSLASPEFSLRYVVPMTVVLIVACYVVFVYGLGLPMPMWMGER